MWQWQVDPENLDPTGYGICGGEVVQTDCYSYSRCSSTSVAQLIVQPELYSDTESSSAVGLWAGTRSGFSSSTSSSSIDMASGLTILSDCGMRVDNVNMIRVGGELLGSNTTPSRNNDVTLRSGPSDTLDGSGSEDLDGGDSDSNTNVVDGGSSRGYGVITVGGIAYAQVIDVVSDYLIYKGWAAVGALTSAPLWRIQKIVIGFDDDVTKTWADGDAEFDNIWNNRLSLTYS